MGFDLSGVNPKMNMKQEELPVYNKYNNMDWSDKMKALDNDEIADFVICSFDPSK